MEKESINRAITKATGLQGNFFDDLNACHEMEKVLTKEQRSDYSHQLAKVLCINFTGNKCMYDSVDQFTQLHATARQRCEAFLRTIGQWEEQ